MALPDFEHECFLISPIGAEGSPVRERADGVRDFIVKPAVEALGLGIEVVRADDIAKPGQITLDVIDHVLKAKVAVADLTDLNPNVFYELAARHAAKLPLVLIAHDEQMEKGLPFDIQQMRTISYDDGNLKKASEAKDAITEYLRAGLDGAVDSPLAAALNLDALRGGSNADKLLADLAALVGDLAREQRSFRRVLRSRLEQPVADPDSPIMRERLGYSRGGGPPIEMGQWSFKRGVGDEGEIRFTVEKGATEPWLSIQARQGERVLRFVTASDQLTDVVQVATDHLEGDGPTRPYEFVVRDLALE